MAEIPLLDLLIVGSGPAGLAAAVEAQRGDLHNMVVVEKGPSHSTMIRTFYKTGKRVDAQYAGLEALCMGILCLKDGNREDYLSLMDQVVKQSNLVIHYNSEVASLKRENGEAFFKLKTTPGQEFHARHVIVAIGKMGKPNQPDYYKSIPPLLKSNKSILFDINARPLEGLRILVVGGGDSATEYAHMLSEKNKVTISYRKFSFSRANVVNKKIIEDLIATQKIAAFLPSNIEKVTEEGGKAQVHFVEKEFGTQVFDVVLYGLGGVTPLEFLKNSGVSVDAKGEPTTNEFHESSCEGLYVVGDLLGKGKGGGSIISGFNSGSEAVRNILKKYYNKELPPDIVSLEHLKYFPQK